MQKEFYEKIKVFVVDDDQRIVSMLKDAIDNEEELEIIGTANHGEDALQQIQRKKPDVVLLDLIMPGIDGLEVIERMRQSDFPQHPEVIVVSADSREAVIERAFELGVTYYILKPFNPLVVMNRIKKVGLAGEGADNMVTTTVFERRNFMDEKEKFYMDDREKLIAIRQ